MDKSNNSMFNHDSHISFSNNHSSSPMVNHSSIHESMHKTTFHEDIHNHDKIHESMHLGHDKIKSPLNNNFND